MKNAWLGVAALAAGILLTKPAAATDYYVEGSVSGGASTWGSDPNVQGALRTGFEFVDIVSVDLQGRIGYSAVDERMIEIVGLGTKLAIPIEPFIPHLRLHALHFHEVPVSAMHEDAFMHVIGVGDGIRHRFGFGAALGASYVFASVDRTKFLAQMEAYVDVFPDDGKGPILYGGGGLGFGIQYDI